MDDDGGSDALQVYWSATVFHVTVALSFKQWDGRGM
jgi:hypothetical protein